MPEIQGPRQDLIDRNNAAARAREVAKERKGIPLDEAIAEIKKSYGFSDEAWEIFSEALGEACEDASLIDRYREREKTITKWLKRAGRCPACQRVSSREAHLSACPLAPVEP